MKNIKEYAYNWVKCQKQKIESFKLYYWGSFSGYKTKITANLGPSTSELRNKSFLCLFILFFLFVLRFFLFVFQSYAIYLGGGFCSSVFIPFLYKKQREESNCKRKINQRKNKGKKKGNLRANPIRGAIPPYIPKFKIPIIWGINMYQHALMFS